MAKSKLKRTSKAASKPSPAPFAPPVWLLAALLALATLILYWPALQNGFVNYDDDRYLTANARVQNGLTFDNIRWAFVCNVADNWHPLTILSNLLVCQLCGLNPWGHHLANVLLHAANAALVFICLRQMTGATWKSLAVAALFAVHPLRVESVAWVAERKDVLSGLFGLLTLIFYTRHARAQMAKPAGRETTFSRDYWLAWFWFALGLMSKPMLVTWPFVLLLLDYWPLKRFKPGCSRRLTLEKIPFLGLAAAVSVVTFIIQQKGEAVMTIQNLSIAARCENTVIAYCRYLGKTFWPTDLMVAYPYPGYWPMAEVLLAVGFLAGLTGLLVVMRQRHPYLLMGWLWFVGTLVPVIGLVQVGIQSMADRYTYLPSLGLLILIVWGAEALTRQWPQRAALLAATGLAAVTICVCITRNQLQYWRDGESLFRHATVVTANNFFAEYELGVALEEKGRLDDAVRQYEFILQSHPNFAPNYVRMGVALAQKGKSDEAMDAFGKAIRVDPNDPLARNDLGLALFKQGRIDEAILQFQEAVRLAPDDPGPRNSFATALYLHGQHDEAVQQFQAALRLNPNFAEAHYNLACILLERGQTNEAIRGIQEALRLKPDYTQARDRLAEIMAAQGKPN